MQVEESVSFKDLTTVKLGGPIAYLIRVKHSDQLPEAIKFAKDKNLPFLVIGGASNLLVSDEGYEGVVIKMENSGITMEGDNLLIQAGTPLQQLVDYTIEQGLDGMSTMTGVPGTVGGALYGSAGAYGDNIRDYLIEVSSFDGEKVIITPKKEYETGYRDSIFKRNKDLIILEAKFSDMPKVDPEELKKEAADILQKRMEKYNPAIKSPGSFFKNVPLERLDQIQVEKVRQTMIEWGKDPDHILRFNKIPAGALIEMAGGNGDQIGEIKTDPNHGNTFMNLGNGTAEDFYALIKKWFLKVKEEFGIELEPEVQLINLPPLNS
jgi:UDP-N-acetylmuramate dehydrogenase